MRLTIEIEQEFRAALVAYIDAEELAGNVFGRRRQFNSRVDFIERTGVKTSDDKTEIRFTEIECIDISDDDVQGADDNPAAVATYNLHAFHQFVDERSDESNSDQDFTALILRLRDKVLNAPKFTLPSGWKVELEPITPPEGTEFTQFGPDTFTDIVGHFKDIPVKATFYEQ